MSVLIIINLLAIQLTTIFEIPWKNLSEDKM